MIDHRYTDDMVCPYCGTKQSGLWELKGAYDEDTLRVECEECEREFDSYCYTSHSFTTSEVDIEAEKRKLELERRVVEEERAKRYAACQAFVPGTPIRVREDSRYADFLCGREGVVSNRELSKHNPFVHVDLKSRGDRNPYPGFACFPDDLELL